MTVEFIQKPQDGRADTVLDLSIAPSFIMYNAKTLKRVTDFFQSEQVSLQVKAHFHWKDTGSRITENWALEDFVRLCIPLELLRHFLLPRKIYLLAKTPNLGAQSLHAVFHL